MATRKRSTEGLGVFPPWFLTKELMRKIEKLLPYYYHTRFRFYFDRYGCLRCGQRDVVYCCSGLCTPCQGLLNDRLKRTDKVMKRRYELTTRPPTRAFLKRLTTARELLSDLRSRI